MGFFAAIASLFFLGARSLQTQNVQYKSYFDESVQGLDLGSAVKFRGVVIGKVANIDVASDHRHVEVSCDLVVKDLNLLGLSVEKAKGLKTKMHIPPDLRVQLVSTGITGVKFIQIDYFNPKDYPPIELPFPIPENYIPAAPSMMKNLEDSVVHAVDRFPAVADQLLSVLVRIDNLLGEIESRKLPERVNTALTHVDQVLADAHSAIGALDTGKLSHDIQGLIVSAQHTSDALGSLAQGANHVGPALEETLRDVQAAAQSIQRLADALERDPDMFIKGRAKRVSQ